MKHLLCSATAPEVSVTPKQGSDKISSGVWDRKS